MLYQDLDQKQKRDDDKMLPAAKHLKLVTTSTGPGTKHRGVYNPHGTNTDAPNEPINSTPPNQPQLPCDDWGPGPHQDQHPCMGVIIYAAEGLIPMPDGHGQRFCAAFLRKGAPCCLNPCPTPHICINDLLAKDKKIWSDHVRSTPCMSFNTKTVNKALIAATLPNKEPGEMKT